MATNWKQGRYTVINPQKYAGNKAPLYRSSWELKFCQFCDTHPNVIQWTSEGIKIPYRNPLTGKNTVYVPDFFVVYEDKNGQRRAELVEIKPMKQTTLKEAGRSMKNKAHAIINQAKWEAANRYCRAQKITFRVITESDIFRMKGKK